MKSNKKDAYEQRNKKTAGEIGSKILAVLCIIATVVLLGVTVFAFINAGRNQNPDTGSNVPGVISKQEDTTTTETPTETTTQYVQPNVEGVDIKGKIYAKEDTYILAEASVDASAISAIKKGDSIDFVSVDSDGWCTVVFNNAVCYVHRNYFSTEKPEEQEGASTAESTTATGTSASVSGDGTSKVVNVNQKHWYAVVVDKNRVLPEGFVPEIENVANSGHALDSRASVYYDAMYKAAYAEGIVLTPYSGYRSYETQNNNYNNLVQQYINAGLTAEQAAEKASTEILPAGSSEHNLGLAMDICGTEESFRYSEEYKWLCENAYTYGFIERYPEGKQDVTGVIAEPWHWRFVGPAVAEDMNAKGIITLEEYLQYKNVAY